MLSVHVGKPFERYLVFAPREMGSGADLGVCVGFWALWLESVYGTIEVASGVVDRGRRGLLIAYLLHDGV